MAELADEVARHEDGAALLGEVAEVVAQPADAVGVEAVGRFVEQQDARVAEQRTGEGQTLAHAEGEPAGPLVHRGLEPDLGQHLLDPIGGDAADRGHGPEVVAGGAAGVHASGVEDGADDAGRVGGGRCSGRRRSGPRRHRAG